MHAYVHNRAFQAMVVAFLCPFLLDDAGSKCEPSSRSRRNVIDARVDVGSWGRPFWFGGTLWQINLEMENHHVL